MNKVVAFTKESYEELKKIQWPTRKDTIRLTGYVIGVSLFVGLFVSLFDYVFKGLLTYLLNK